LDQDELAKVEAAFQRALSGDRSALQLLGFGELSVVVGWPADEPVVACKRLPVFPSSVVFEQYAAVVRAYVDEVRTRGVCIVPTEVISLPPRRDGTVVAYHAQPVLPAEAIGLAIARATPPSVDHPVLPAIVAAVVSAISDRVGVDAQMANWWWDGEQVHQLDLTTPFMVDEHGHVAFDMSPWLRIIPGPLRPVMRSEFTSLVQRWLTPRGALLDLVANLYKERLEGWVEPALHHINAAVTPAVTADQAHKVFRSDRRLFPLLLRVEKGYRGWTRWVRRRPYEFLLPERTTYG